MSEIRNVKKNLWFNAQNSSISLKNLPDCNIFVVTIFCLFSVNVSPVHVPSQFFSLWVDLVNWICFLAFRKWLLFHLILMKNSSMIYLLNSEIWKSVIFYYKNRGVKTNSIFHLQLLRTSDFIFICAEEVHVIKMQTKQWTELFHAVGSCVIFSHGAKWKAWVNVFQMLKIDCSFLFIHTYVLWNNPSSAISVWFLTLYWGDSCFKLLVLPPHPKFLFELVLRLFLNLVHLQDLFVFSSQ